METSQDLIHTYLKVGKNFGFNLRGLHPFMFSVLRFQSTEFRGVQWSCIPKVQNAREGEETG
jgi:hypothetical protein